MRRYPQPIPGTVDVIAVHCFGCGRQLGVTHEEKTYVHCTELCWHQEQLPSLEHAARDRMIRFMWDQGAAQREIAETFDMTRPRIYQIIADGNSGDDYLMPYRRK